MSTTVTPLRGSPRSRPVGLEHRVEVRLLGAQALGQFMDFRAVTVRALAAQVGCSASVVGHLRSGRRSTCLPATARRIEAALMVPPGTLFVPRVFTVGRDIARTPRRPR